MKQEIQIFDNNLQIEEDELFRTEFEIFPDIKEVKSESVVLDMAGRSVSRSKYKISLDPIEVSVKEIEAYREPPVKYAIKDGVVLESEISKDGDVFCSEDDMKEAIGRLKERIEWQKPSFSFNAPFIFFILSRHPEIISKEEFRKFLRQTDERIKSGLSKVEKTLKEIDASLQIVDRSDEKRIWYPDSEEIPKEKYQATFDRIVKDVYTPLFKEGSTNYPGISKDEFLQSPKILKCIDLFLNEEIPLTNKDENISSTKNISNNMKWMIVVILSIIALSWGLWAAIGVFIFGSIIIYIISK